MSQRGLTLAMPVTTDPSCLCSIDRHLALDWHPPLPHPLIFHSPADVFHWSCLNSLASRLPLHTAPAGYQCPVCQGPLFPPSNLASPIADVLKEQLASVNWARAGLGLPLVRELTGGSQPTRQCFCKSITGRKWYATGIKTSLLMNQSCFSLTDWGAHWHPRGDHGQWCHWLHWLVNVWWWDLN